jgi:hypothetical protein
MLSSIVAAMWEEKVDPDHTREDFIGKKQTSHAFATS